MVLNPGQKEIVEFKRGVLQVVAGPGTGKTEALVRRVVNLLENGFPPDSIVMVTFTRKAAEEFSTRLLEKAKESGVDPLGVYCGTLHSLCFQIMDEFGFDEIAEKKLIDDFSRKVFIYDVFKDNLDRFPEFFGRFLWEESTSPMKFVDLVEALVDRIAYYDVDLERMEAEGNAYREAVEIYRTYQKALNDRGFIDFNAVEKLFLKFLDSHHGKEFLEKVKHLLVDEYQDTNPLDEKIYFKIASSVESFVVVGDEDQSLYSFRGATVRSFIEFESRVKNALKERFDKEFPFKKVFLVENYRSDKDIINFLNYFIDSFHNLGLERVEGKDSWKLQPSDDREEDRGRRVSYPCSEKVREVLSKPEWKFVDFDRRMELTKLLRRELARNVAGLIEELLNNGSISRVSDCVLLVPSAREKKNSFISFLRRELESRGIKIYNPRSKSFGEKENVKRVVEVLQFVVEENKEPPEFLDERVEELKEKFKNGDMSLLETFYALLPLMGYLTDESFRNPEVLFDLSQLSNFIRQFEAVYPKEELSEKFSSVFVELIKEADEPELPPDHLPDQYLPVMTIHQAKGLEFPVVFVAVDWLYEDDSDKILNFLRKFVSPDLEELLPPKEDIWSSVRKFFVAFSRAKELLVILDTRMDAYQEGSIYPSKNWEDRYGYRRGNVSKLCRRWSSDGQGKGEVEDPRFYSYTGDIVSFSICPRLYGLRKFFRFAPSSAVQEWFGTVIHRTLRRVYLFWKLEGKLPDRDKLLEIFEHANRSLEIGGVPRPSEEDRRAALSVIEAFLQNEGEDFYKRVVSMEFPVKVKKENYYLKGVIDALVEGESGLEIWDFKSMRNPRRKGREELLELYRKQLQFYWMILKERGTDPKVERLVLYFLNELFEKEPVCKEVFSPNCYGEDEFWQWVIKEIEKIEKCRRENSWPVSQNPDENTCRSCDFRFGCPVGRDIIQAT